MSRHFSSGTSFFLVVSLVLPALGWPAITPDLLGSRNFTLYRTPCPANDMFLTDVAGGSFSLSALRGKVIILNFWRIDCPPCAMEKPVLERIHRKYSPRGLAVVAVNLFDDGNRIRDYRAKCGFTFPIVFDPAGRCRVHTVSLRSGMPSCCVVNPKYEAIYEIPAVPTTYVIDREGRIVGHGFGMINWEQPPFSELLETLLAGNVRTAAGSSLSSVQPGFEYAAAAGPLTPAPAGASPGPKGGDASQQASSSEPQSPRLPFEGADTPQKSVKHPATIRPVKAAAFQKSGRAIVKAPKDISAAAPSVGTPSRGPAPSQRRPVSVTPGGLPQAGAAPVSRPPSPRYVPGPGEWRGYTASMPQSGAAAPAVPRSASTLPQALPYDSSRPETYRAPTAQPYQQPRQPGLGPPVEPDKNGYITARIPSGASASNLDRLPAPAAPAPLTRPTLPSATPVTPTPVTDRSSIEGFILESFRGPKQQPVPVTSSQQARRPEPTGSSVFGQLRKIGGGIQDTFSKIIPIR